MKFWVLHCTKGKIKLFTDLNNISAPEGIRTFIHLVLSDRGFESQAMWIKQFFRLWKIVHFSQCVHYSMHYRKLISCFMYSRHTIPKAFLSKNAPESPLRARQSIASFTRLERYHGQQRQWWRYFDDRIQPQLRVWRWNLYLTRPKRNPKGSIATGQVSF